MIRFAVLLVTLTVGTTLSAGLLFVGRSAQVEAWQTKIDPWVMETVADGSESEFLVYLAEQADLSGAAELRDKEAKGLYVYRHLTEVAGRTQPDILNSLEQAGVQYRPFWVANMVWVRADQLVLAEIARRHDVRHIYANPEVTLALPPALDTHPEIQSTQAVEWNLNKVNAPAVWSAGYAGQGVVIGGQDTGYQWNHPALINQYRGWNGTTAAHDYNWHDAIHTSGSPCVENSPVPCDDDSHGTHTMGTMVGDDGGANQIGMAPAAKWIGCRNMKRGVGTPATYAECYQWFIAPTDLNDQNPNPAKAPHVINNSWSCPPSEGCTDPNVLRAIVENVRAAGILTAHSAGNSGSACATVRDPSAIYDASFTVGATGSSDAIASFSSRGPVTVDSSGRLKPDIVAPGLGVRSSWTGSGYGSKSGTSMAAPHVAGLVALLISASPALAGDIDTIEALIQTTAVPLTTSQGCGGDGPADVPNHVYGYGRIDALAAFTCAAYPDLQVVKSAPPVVSRSQLLTYTLSVMHGYHPSGTNNIFFTDTIPVQTTFMTATNAHLFNGSTVTWTAAALPACASLQEKLIVTVSPSATGVISNDRYAVRSDEFPLSSPGAPVTTTVRPYIYYFPFFMVD